MSQALAAAMNRLGARSNSGEGGEDPQRFTPDDKTLFVAVQHPGTDGTVHFPGFERVSTFEDPATRWPDFKSDMG